MQLVSISLEFRERYEKDPMAPAGLPVSRQKRQWSFHRLRRVNIEILLEAKDYVVPPFLICLPG